MGSQGPEIVIFLAGLVPGWLGGTKAGCNLYLFNACSETWKAGYEERRAGGQGSSAGLINTNLLLSAAPSGCSGASNLFGLGAP